MNITFLTSYFSYSNYGGANKVLMDMANQFSLMGHSITVITQQLNNKRYIFNDKIRLIEVGGPLPSNPFHWLRLRRIKALFLEELSKLYSDIIIPHSFPLNYFATSLDKKYYGKILFYCHEPYRFFHDKTFISKLGIKDKLICLILRLFFSKTDIKSSKEVDMILANSNYQKTKIYNAYKRDALVCYPNPKIKYPDQIKNFNLRSHLNLDKNSKILFSIGLSSHMKGAKELVLIFNDINKKLDNVFLLIAGKTSEQNQKIIDKQINTLGIPSDKIVSYGFVENNNLCNIFSQVDITLYTAIEEPFGLIPIESQIQKTPVIAFEGGPSETIIDNRTGFVLKTGDIKGYSEKVQLLLENDELRETFGKEGYENVMKMFTFEKFIEQFEEIMKNLLEK